MIGMMVELRVAPGSTDAFERAFAVQAAAVRANEPRTLLYELFKSRTVADCYTLIEIYEDEAALSAHRTSSHMVTNRPLTEPFLAAPPVMQHIRDVADHGAHVAASRCQRRLHPLGTGRRRTSVWDLHEDNVNPCYCFRQAS
ncbi:Quinol monooxygenase YgiN [Rhizobium sp. AN5]|uniref:putative quinol monooxygenase n=1 Tax=Rhizobium sp. AN5 TaxID=1855304 RepID=UPI000BD54FE1|nr:putative quinol monooxygenase [Rhizobium sp. AN5]SOC90298.1 Quinol monooxygenase YgiN [Rhizobium sp. AN5]